MDYNLRWNDLNTRLRQTQAVTGELSVALAELETHHRDCGFIKDDLSEVERLAFPSPGNPALTLRAQINPKRARRHDGSGVRTPPPDTESLNGGCFLCRENIRWQQNGLQVGFEIGTTRDLYHAWMNPFPLMHNHIVIAAEDHMSQEWDLTGTDPAHISVARMISDLCETAASLPSHVGFYNGVDAGSSIPGHLHFQFFRRPAADPLFPLEQRPFTSPTEPGAPQFINDYPVPVALWRGPVGDVVDRAGEWLRDWAAANAHRRARLSSNFIATGQPTDGGVSLYFIPRDRNKQWWNSDRGIVGGLELLGELVLASEEECAMLDDGRVDYAFIERALAAVHTPFIDG